MRDYSPLRGLAASSPTVHLKSSTVVELLDELDRLRSGAAKPTTPKRNDYPAEFEAVWEVYPARPGDSKKAAHKAWAVRIKAGATAVEMLVGAQAYAAYVKAMKVEPVFIKQAATFFGPGEHFAADWTPPEQVKKSGGGGAWWASDATRLAKAIEVGVGPAHFGESTPSYEARIRAAIDNGGAPPAPTATLRPALVPASAASPLLEQRAPKPEGMGALKDLVRKVVIPARAA